VIVASAAWAKGSVFRRVARQLKQILIMSSKWDASTMSTATLQDLEKAIALIKINVTNSAQVNIQTETETETKNFLKESEDKSPLHFASIGGNEQAKVSLEDALAFDPAKRDMLSRFGLSPPTGVLLYGPPGTGKTLLAKAVARMLKDPSSGEPGGTFMSLSVSEIVSAEVGTSEKMIASSFEFAEKNAPSVSYLVSTFFFLFCWPLF
jgi:SpoVK/Ycf46/Vps4 family AAA+-type ATPase